MALLEEGWKEKGGAGIWCVDSTAESSTQEESDLPWCVSCEQGWTRVKGTRGGLVEAPRLETSGLISPYSHVLPVFRGASPMAQQLRTHLQCRRHGFDPWVRKIPWRSKWQPSPVFLPGKSHGQRSLVGYSLRDGRVRHDLVTKQQQ